VGAHGLEKLMSQPPYQVLSETPESKSPATCLASIIDSFQTPTSSLSVEPIKVLSPYPFRNMSAYYSRLIRPAKHLIQQNAAFHINGTIINFLWRLEQKGSSCYIQDLAYGVHSDPRRPNNKGLDGRVLTNALTMLNHLHSELLDLKFSMSQYPTNWFDYVSNTLHSHFPLPTDQVSMVELPAIYGK